MFYTLVNTLTSSAPFFSYVSIFTPVCLLKSFSFIFFFYHIFFSLERDLIQKYPSIQRFCADAGYRNSFEKDVESQLNRGIYISSRIKSDWDIIPKRWIVERTFSWFNNSRRLSKDYEVSLLYAQSMCMIAAFCVLISRFWPIGAGS